MDDAVFLKRESILYALLFLILVLFVVALQAARTKAMEFWKSLER
jgi:preprotein translocase subunit SecG